MRLLGFLLIVGIALAGSSTYNNQGAWGGICTSGLRQSPININTSNITQCGNTKASIFLWDGPTTVEPLTGPTSSLHSEFPSSILSIVDNDNNMLQYVAAQYHIHVGS